MATYGSCKFGNGKYGAGQTCAPAATFTGPLFWAINIKWDNTFINEAANTIGLESVRGRRQLLSAGGQTFETIQPGRLTLTLDNRDGRFDPYNSSSPLYGHIEPGLEVCVKVKVLATGIWYPVFTGRVADIQPAANRYQATLVALDYLRWMYDADISVAQKVNIKANTAIGYILEQAGYPYPRSIAASNLPIYIFDPSDSNALTTIQQITDASLGTFFVTADGIARYDDVGAYRGDTHDIDQEKLLKEIVPKQPWELVRNNIKILCTRRALSATPEIIWSYGNVLLTHYLGGVPVVIHVTHDPAQEIEPQRGLDFIAGASPDLMTGGSSSDFYIDVTRSNITSTGCDLTVVNHGFQDLYVRLQLRGYKQREEQVKFTDTDATSIQKYGPRRFNLSSPWLQDRGFGAAYVTVLKNFLKSPSKSPIVKLENRFTEQFDVELLDRMHLTAAKLGIDATFDVGSIEHRWLNPSGQAVQTTLYLQTLLYTATDPVSIPPEPYDPKQPPIPTDPGTPGDPNDPGALPLCATDPASPATGPYPLGNGEINNAADRYAYIPVKYIFRPGNFTNPTRLVITGQFLQLVYWDWAAMPNSSWSIDAISDTGAIVASGVISGSGGSRTITFPSLKTGVMVAKLRIDFQTTGVTSTGYFTTGPQIKSITAAGTDGTGVTTNLESGKIYAGYTSGQFGYWSGNPAWWSKIINLSSDGSSFVWRAGSDYTGGWYSLAANNGVLAAQAYGDGTQTLVYFKMNGTILKFRCADANFADNTGSMNLAIFPAAPSSKGDKKIMVESMQLFNVCEAK